MRRGSILPRLLETAADAGLGLGARRDLRRSGRGRVEVVDLLRVEGELGVARLMVDLHRLDVGGGDLAERTLELGVPPFLLPQPVLLPRLAAAAVRRRRVDLRSDLLRRVLLWLRLPRTVTIERSTPTPPLFLLFTFLLTMAAHLPRISPTAAGGPSPASPLSSSG